MSVYDKPGLFVPGSIIAQRFVVERSIGAGGMGLVFLVRHATLGERFALKVLRNHGSSDARASARFQREARAAASLRCEHAVRVIDFGFLDDQSPFFVMEFIEGQSLSARLRDHGPLPTADAVRAAMHACAALAEAHAYGIVHRDVKPANLLQTTRSDGSPLIKLADFGVAKLQQAESLTDTHASLGSPAYMAPEQIRDARAADVRSDVWSVGITLYELLAGQTPFHAFTAPGILSRVLTDEPTPLRSLCRELPPGLVSAVERCLEKDPDRRFPSVVELAQALAPFAPEPREDERVRRIDAHARRPVVLPEATPLATPPAAVAGQITDATTSLTQAPESAGPASLVPPPPSARQAPPRSWRAALPVGALVAVLIGGYGVTRRPVESPTPAVSASVSPIPTASATAPTTAPATPEIQAVQGPAAPAATPAALASAATGASSAPRPAARRAPSPAAPRPNAHPLGEFGSRQ